jgi:hypothetical protein
MSRVSKSCPYTGTLHHRDHRSKKGRGRFSKKYRKKAIERKLLLEKLRIKDLENEIIN